METLPAKRCPQCGADHDAITLTCADCLLKNREARARKRTHSPPPGLRYCASCNGHQPERAFTTSMIGDRTIVDLLCVKGRPSTRGRRLTLAMASAAPPQNISWVRDLHSRARETVEHNLISRDGREYLAAGGFQYRSLWVRDAAYSASGLARIGRQNVTRNHIELYLDHSRDGIGPKGFDIMPLEQRVIHASVRRLFCLGRRSLPFPENKPLIPLYQDSRGARAVDSNLTVLLSVFECTQEDMLYFLQGDRLAQLKAIFAYYDELKNTEAGGLIFQGAHSDWQDSQKRAGAIFLTNLMYYEISSRFAKHGIDLLPPEELVLLKETIHSAFFDPDSGLYRTASTGEHFSLDANLLALRWGFVTDADAKQLYKNLLRSPLWRGHATKDYFARTDCFCCFGKIKGGEDTGFPGFAAFPSYPKSDAALQVRLAGLQTYHDTMYWSWLMALSGEIAYRMGDISEGDRVAQLLSRLAERDGSIGEVYAHNPDFPLFTTILFASERPFSWGAAFVLDMLAEREEYLSKNNS